jgi:hypothetical protein
MIVPPQVIEMAHRAQLLRVPDAVRGAAHAIHGSFFCTASAPVAALRHWYVSHRVHMDTTLAGTAGTGACVGRRRPGDGVATGQCGTGTAPHMPAQR